VALANTAWGVLKQSLIEESATGKFNDFREGAGVDALKALDSMSYMALMRELSACNDPAVRKRVVATMASINNVGSSRILKEALNDPSLAVRMEAAAILGARGDHSVYAVFQRAVANRGRDDRFLVLTAMKRVGQKWMVPLLRRYLHDSDAFMRVSAAEGLARLGDEQAYMLLRRSMHANNKYLRSSAYAAVQDAGGRRSVSMLLKALNDRDPAIRLYAAVYLAKDKRPDGLHVLEVTLHNPNPALRLTAVDALSQLNDVRCLRALVVALGDSDPEVRVSAAAGLLQHKKGNGIPVLVQALRDNRAEVRLKAVEAACLGCPGPGLAILQSALLDPSRTVRIAAVQGIVKVAEVRDRAAIMQALAHPDPGVHVAAAIVLLRLDDPAAAPALTRYVKDGAAERAEILEVMERVKVADMAPYLKTIATRGPLEERLHAVKALAVQDAGPATEALSYVARNGADEKLQVAAVHALGTVDGDLSTYLLKSLLKEEATPTVQVEAAAILGERGVDSAAPVLRKAVASNNVKAARALCKIGDPAGAVLYQQMLSSADLSERIEAAIVLYKLQRTAPLSVE
jgi:HEAT repeat protein